MEVVTIEGSITPCVELARGDRRTVLYNEHVKRCIRQGYFILVARHGDEVAEMAEPDELWTPSEPVFDTPDPEEDDDDPGSGVPEIGDDQPLGT